MTRCSPGDAQEVFNGPVALSEASFFRFASFITGELGIKMPDSKLTMVQSRLLRRVRELRLDSLDKYADYCFASPNIEEREHLINAITTNKTDFFREAEHFTYLVEAALPALRGDRIRGGERFKVWSAGCSSGEEPYTLAMVLAEYARRHAGFDFAILATDVSTKVLDRAKSGIYREPDVLAVPPELQRRYLLRSRNKGEQLVRVASDLRSKVSFHQLNFMQESYAVKDTFDVVFFRNVIIYFDRSTQTAVIKKICGNLAPGGYLFAGHSESLAGLNVPVKPLKASIYRKPG